jgi:hypothetical protein
MSEPIGKQGTCDRCANDKTIYNIGGTNGYDLCWGCIELMAVYGG